MNARAAALVAAAFVLVGCAAVPPPGPTDADAVDYRQRILERSWQNTGLAGEAPQIDATVAPTYDLAMQAVSTCVSSAVSGGFSWGFGPADGFELMGASGGDLDDPAVQRAFYLCVAATTYPPDLSDVLTSAQLDYIYDYLAEWLVPCIITEGYRIEAVPTRDEFHDLYGQWSPYASVTPSVPQRDYERLAAACGPEVPAY